ncbi:MAG: thioredoxin [Treponema sp.]|nr:thioredoxin [Treponema sp.]
MATVALTEANFQAEVLDSDKPVLVDFWASWCGPCKMMGPVVEEISNERTDIKVGKVNVDDEADLAQKYSIMSIPAFILFKDGKVAAQAVGGQPKEGLLAALGL